MGEITPATTTEKGKDVLVENKKVPLYPQKQADLKKTSSLTNLSKTTFSDESEKGDQKRAGVNRPLSSRPLVSLPPPNVGCEGDFGRAGFIDRGISLWGTLDLVREGDRLHNTISNANTESRIKVTKVVLCEVSLTNSSK